MNKKMPPLMMRMPMTLNQIDSSTPTPPPVPTEAKVAKKAKNQVTPRKTSEHEHSHYELGPPPLFKVCILLLFQKTKHRLQ